MLVLLELRTEILNASTINNIAMEEKMVILEKRERFR